MSATGTAIQMQRVRPGGAVLIGAVIAATLGVGFFVGRATESTVSNEPAAVSAIVPEIGLGTDRATVMGRIYDKTFGGSIEGTDANTVGGFQPHLPKRAKEAPVGTVEAPNTNPASYPHGLDG